MGWGDDTKGWGDDDEDEQEQQQLTQTLPQDEVTTPVIFCPTVVSFPLGSYLCCDTPPHPS